MTEEVCKEGQFRLVDYTESAFLVLDIDDQKVTIKYLPSEKIITVSKSAIELLSKVTNMEEYYDNLYKREKIYKMFRDYDIAKKALEFIASEGIKPRASKIAKEALKRIERN